MAKATTTPKKNALSKMFSDLSGDDASALADTGVGVVTDIIGASQADSAHKGQATGQAIGGGVGAAAGMLIGGPLGAGIGKTLGGMVGGIFGGKGDQRRAVETQTNADYKQNMNVDLTANVNPYGQYAEGGLVDGPGETPPGTKRRLTPSEMQQWNKYLDYVKGKGLQGSKDLDVRDKNLGASLFNEFKNSNKDVTIDYSIVPHVQNEFQQLQQSARDLEARHGRKSEGVFSGISEPDAWFGSKTSQQYFPSMEVQTFHNGQLQSVQNKGLVDGKLNPTGAGVAPTVRRGKPKYGDVGAIELEDGSMVWKDEAPHMEEGGGVGVNPMQGEPDMMQEQFKTINIEKGELLADTDGKVVREFKNPNRFSAHADSQYKEPMGNFTQVPEGHVVIPKKLANRFKTGDALTRKSIMRQLVDNQRQDPTINMPKGDNDGDERGGMGDRDGDEQYGEGGYIDDAYANEMRRRAGIGVRPPNLLPLGIAETERQLPTVATPGVQPVANATENSGVNNVNDNAAAPQTPTKRKFDFGMLGRRVEGKLPSIYQMIKANEGDPYLKPVFNQGFDAARSDIMQMPEDYNVNDQIAAIDSNTALGINAVSQANTPAARAEAAAMIGKSNEAKGQILSNAARAKGQMKTNKLQALAGLDMNQGGSNQQEAVRFQTEQRMNEANRENIMANGLSENYRMDAGWQNDMEKIKMINSMSKFENIDPFTIGRFTDDPGAIDYIYGELSKSRPLAEILKDKALLTNATTSGTTKGKSK